MSNHDDLIGLGGERSDGRWHTARRGNRVVYLSEHPAVALIEVLANLHGNPVLFPTAYYLMKLEAADTVSTDVISLEHLSPQWRGSLMETRSAGDLWLDSQRSALLQVPSVPSPESLNYLFNPLHKDAAGIAKIWCRRLEYDRRLFHLR